jgi:hypothetical protein
MRRYVDGMHDDAIVFVWYTYLRYFYFLFFLSQFYIGSPLDSFLQKKIVSKVYVGMFLHGQICLILNEGASPNSSVGTHPQHKYKKKNQKKLKE